MKKLKNIIFNIVAVATIGSVLVIPINTNAEYIGKSENYIDNDFMKYLEENAVTEAIITVEDDNEYSATYYFNNHGIKDIIDKNGVIAKIDDSFDTSMVKNRITLNKNYFYFYSDEGSFYSQVIYDYELHEFVLSDNAIPKIDEERTITVGESTYPRGDINLDGKVNTLDLLMLKKYLLGLMEW